MITTDDTACITPGLANVRISGQTVRRRLCESGFRARRPKIVPILKQRHRTARLAWARTRRRWRLHIWQHTLFSEESRFSLRFSDGRYRVYRRHGNILRTSVCTSPIVLVTEVLWSGMEFVMMVALSSKLFKEH